LSERVKAGLNRARDEGKVLGRPKKIANIKNILKDRNSGMTIRQIAKEQNLSIGKVHKILRGVRDG
jgi:DNA invertase Pin-like site-specific DNA recombinase